MKTKMILIAFVLSMAAMPATAATYYVGNCHAGSFPTISAAVSSSSVAAGSTIKVCAGTYNEQVVISKALTLQGIANGSLGSATIAGSASDSTLTDGEGELIRPSIIVNASPVNITGMNIMQTLSGTDCYPPSVVGIFYASGASGTVNHSNVSILPAANTACQVSYGVLAENYSSTLETVNVQNSTFEVMTWGIAAVSLQPQLLSVTLSGNQIYVLGSTGITLNGASGTVSGNLVLANSEGLSLWASVQAKNNTINAYTGIAVGPNTPTISSNKIRGHIGVDFFCNPASATGNTIYGGFGAMSSTGLNSVPSSFSGTNTFFNIATQTVFGSGC